MSDNRDDLTPAAADIPATPSQPMSDVVREPEQAREVADTAAATDAGTDAPTVMFGPALPPPPPPSWIPQPQPEVPAQRSRGRLRLTAGLTALVLVSGGAGGLVASSVSGGSSAAASPVSTALKAATEPVSASTSTAQSYAAIAAKVLPVVVSIDVVAGSSGDTGSGIVLTSDGYILTNNHVVTAATSGGSVTVHFNDGSTASAKIVGTDLASDLAVIKVAKTGLAAANLGDSSKVRVGDAVLAVGSPLGLTGTVTSGIVSALNRPVDTTADQSQQQQQQTDPFGGFGSNGSGGSGDPSGGDSSTTSSVATVFGAIQTDAAINPGNSGGALVDAAGNVIGINSAIASLGSGGSSSQSGNIGVGFAIPINLAKTIAQELIRTGKATHAQIGVSVGTSTDQTTGATTVVVSGVTAGGPGAKAGLEQGDVITKIGDTVVTDADTLIATVRSHNAGDKVDLTITRDGATKTITVTIGSSSS